MKRVLIVYATAGAGHKMAAKAVYESLLSHPGVEAVLVDLLDHTSSIYKTCYSGGYTFLVSRLPWLWAFFFWLMDIPWLQPLIRLGRRFENGVQAAGLHRYLEQEQFDAIISTHFTSNEVAAFLKRKGRIRSQVISVVTDFDVHKFWLAEGIDRYAVASEWTFRKMLKLRVPEEKVRVTGIPVAAKFTQPRDRRTLRAHLGLHPEDFTVLVATGSFGIGPIAELLDQLAGVQVMVVCGHNKTLYENLRGRESEQVKILGLVNNMDELMAAADAMVTKPGGLSISEALVSGLPMIFFSAIPGQETNNIRVLKEYGVGLSGQPVAQIALTLKQWQADPAQLQAARERIRALARPSAVADIISMLQ